MTATVEMLGAVTTTPSMLLSLEAASKSADKLRCGCGISVDTSSLFVGTIDSFGIGDARGERGDNGVAAPPGVNGPLCSSGVGDLLESSDAHGDAGDEGRGGGVGGGGGGAGGGGRGSRLASSSEESDGTNSFNLYCSSFLSFFL